MTLFFNGYCTTECSVVLFFSKDFPIGAVMVSMLAPSAVDRGFEPRSGQTNDCKIGTGCISAKHVALRRKSKDWLAQNQDNVSISGAICLPAGLNYKNPTQHVGLVQSIYHHHLIES